MPNHSELVSCELCSIVGPEESDWLTYFCVFDDSLYCYHSIAFLFQWLSILIVTFDANDCENALKVVVRLTNSLKKIMSA